MPKVPEKFESLARGALLEITTAETIGACVGSVDEGDGVTSVLFASAMLGYPGWKWTVSIASVDDSEPTVLEAELMPGDGALLSPDWVPWSDRLAEYKAAQEALDAEEVDGETDDDDEVDDADDESDDLDDLDEDDDLDDLDDDDDDLDPDGADVHRMLHGGDLDGVDIDDLDESELDEV
jgi:hypothetical protein